MKRFIVVVLALVALVMGLSLSACGGSKLVVKDVVMLENLSAGGFVPVFYGSVGDEEGQIVQISFANIDGTAEINWDAADYGDDIATKDVRVEGKTYQALEGVLPLVITYEGKDYLQLVSSGTTFALEGELGGEIKLIFNPADAELYEM